MYSVRPSLFCLTLLLGFYGTVLNRVSPRSAQDSESLSREKMAVEAVNRLEKEADDIAVATSDDSKKSEPKKSEPKKSEPRKSTQDRLNEEHKKAKEGGYDKEFHQAIRDHGGKRLREEWKKNCNSRSTKPDQRELNCY